MFVRTVNMKISRGFSIFLLTLLGMGSCFDPPEFPNRPELTFDKVEFIDTPDTDSLVISLSFRDGDGDLGLDPSNLAYISYPFHSQYFFQANGSGEMDSLPTFAAVTQNGVEYHIIDIPNPDKGKLVFERTRHEPGYGHLPELNCQNYEALSPASNVLIDAADLAALDDIAIENIIDTLHGETAEFYQLRDTLYRRTNLNHFNLEVRFYLLKNGTDGTNEEDWEEFDWAAPPFCQPFHMRFPVLSDSPDRPLEGTIRYAMPSLGFQNLFSIRTLRLKMRIRDRALNLSNVVDTGGFTLRDITVN